jgi:hypothetical protein
MQQPLVPVDGWRNQRGTIMIATEPQIIDMGKTHFSQQELRDFGDPRWMIRPKGLTIHVFQCVDCGAHTNTGNPADITHFPSCRPGEAERWERFYKENQA